MLKGNMNRKFFSSNLTNSMSLIPKMLLKIVFDLRVFRKNDLNSIAASPIFVHGIWDEIIFMT